MPVRFDGIPGVRAWFERAAFSVRSKALLLGGGSGTLAVSAGLLLSMAAARLLPESAASRWIFLSACAASIGLAAAIAARWFRRTSNPFSMARSIGEHPLAERSRSAAQLEAELEVLGEKYGCSRELAFEAAREAGSALEGRDPALLLGVSRFAPASAVMLAASAVMLAVALVPKPMRALAGRAVSGPTGLAAKAAELPGAWFEITIRPPPYTELGESRETGRTGSFKALRGSEARVSLKWSPGFKGAEAVRGGVRVPMTREEPGRAHTTFVLDKPFSYRIELSTAAGRISTPEYRAEALEDLPPKVEITGPSFLLKGEKEVGTEDSVEISGRAADDFGLRGVSLAVGLRGDERRIPIAEMKEPQKGWSGSYRLELSSLGLSVGDRVAIALEAVDGDTVSGPKKGRSATAYLKVFSSAEHLTEFLEMLEKAWESMIRWLASDLGQAGMDRESLSSESLGLLREAAAAAEKDRSLPGHVRRAVASAKREIEAAHAAPPSKVGERAPASLGGEIRALEQNVLSLQDLLDAERLRQISVLASDIAARKKRLDDLLEKYRRTKDPAIRREIDAEMAAMEERLRTVSRLLAKTAKGWSDIRGNREALKESDLSKLAETMREARKGFAEDDPGALAKKLDEIARKMDALNAEMNDVGSAMGGSRFSELAGEAAGLMRDLDEAAAGQKDLLDGTMKLREELRGREARKVAGRAAELKAKLGRMIREFKEDAAQIPPGLEARDEGRARGLQESLNGLEKLVGGGEFWDAREEARAISRLTQEMLKNIELRGGGISGMHDLMRMLETGRDALEKAGKKAAGWNGKAAAIETTLDRMFPPPSELMSGKEAKQVSDMAGGQEELAGKTAKIRERFSRLQREVPSLPGAPGEKLDEAAGNMRSAAGSLKALNPYGARSRQEGALEALKGAREALQKLSKPGPGSGMPFAQGADEEGGGMDFGHRMARERVEIPRPSEYVVPREYRQDIIDAMKERATRGYEELTRKYYEEITK